MDILTPANNTSLGPGWFPLEAYRAESFRWVTNDAEIYVASLRNVKHYLQIHLEPGPGLNLKPFELLVKEQSQTLARTTVKGRQMISIELPAAEPAVRNLVLHIEGGGRPAPNDTRVLNFRVFKITFMPARSLTCLLPKQAPASVPDGIRWKRSMAKRFAGLGTMPKSRSRIPERQKICCSNSNPVRASTRSLSSCAYSTMPACS